MTETPEDIQVVIEEVDDRLKDALEHANRYSTHDEVRPSALMAFDKVEEARKRLDDIDNREFSKEVSE